VKRSFAALAAQATLPLLRRLEPERAHRLALRALKLVPWRWSRPELPADAGVTLLGLRFDHPVGIAAGLDKDGDYLDALGAIGFSHIEVGTVTPRPQPGNPRPRLFRVPEAEALVNRMGFNSKGVDYLVERLRHSRFRGIRGISIGKNADTPLDVAHNDYVTCFERVYALADYVAVNVSSPNTSNLRELQAQVGLQRIVAALQERREQLQTRFGKHVPLFVKIAPDFTETALAALAAELRALAVDGVIATNTTVDLSAVAKVMPADTAGGLSGAPLHAKSVAVVRQLRAELGAGFPIIGVGGITNAAAALGTLAAGADLIQVYTGLIYRGPMLLHEILAALAREHLGARSHAHGAPKSGVR